MSTFKEYSFFAKAFVVMLAVVGLLFLPKMAFKGTVVHMTEKALTEEEERSDNFEDHLFKAKQLVAKELNYEGSLDNLELYTNAGYYSYKLLTPEGWDSGSFSDDSAKKELRLAVSYRDNHADITDVVAASANGIEYGAVYGFIVAFLVAAAIVGTACFCVDWLDCPDTFKKEDTKPDSNQ